MKTLARLIRHLLGSDIATGPGTPPKCWRYRLEQHYRYSSPHLAGITWVGEWATIYDGTITIRRGYAWDGCTPAWPVLGLFYLGTPDGAQHLGKPAAYYASLVHDVLCQWRLQIPITRAASVALFRDMLRETGFPLASLYASAVAWLGPQRFAGNQAAAP